MKLASVSYEVEQVAAGGNVAPGPRLLHSQVRAWPVYRVD